jgi:hypothetical protein
VASKDFADLIEQFCLAERKSVMTAAENMLTEIDAHELMNIVTCNLKVKEGY